MSLEPSVKELLGVNVAKQIQLHILLKQKAAVNQLNTLDAWQCLAGSLNLLSRIFVS